MVITSVKPFRHYEAGGTSPPKNLTVIGSTTRSDGTPRLFRVEVPALDCFFNGTGDLFAALTVARLREAVFSTPELRTAKSWVSPDDVTATELPLAKATVKVLASMHSILEKTMEARAAELAVQSGEDLQSLDEKEMEKQAHLRRTKAAEVRLVRNVKYLRDPVVEFRAEEWKKEDLPRGLQS